MKIKYLPQFILCALTASILTAYASEKDEDIITAFNNSYVSRNYLKNDDIKIKSKNGHVTLTGSATDGYHKSLAGEMAANINGVTDVDNDLKVKPNQPNKNSDEWIHLKVKTALLFHSNVNSTTEVKVKNGIVTLQGNAKNEAQKELTTEDVKDVDGVKSVINEMKVANETADKDSSFSQTIDDASITAEVKMSLLNHRSTSAIHTKVKTMDGIVTLDGKSKNAAEKELAGKLTADIKGVKSVVNNMTY